MSDRLQKLSVDPKKEVGKGAVRQVVYQRRTRTSEFHLKKMDILSSLKYEPGVHGMPLLTSKRITITPSRLIAFSKAVSSKDYSQTVHFYEADSAFARIMHNPQKYAEILGRFDSVISPDFSQHLDMPPFLCLQNSWWNKAFGAYWQILGINVIPNVSWSRPDSYDYAFAGIPKESVIAINCTAIKGNPMSRYFWMKGYEANAINLKISIETLATIKQGLPTLLQK